MYDNIRQQDPAVYDAMMRELQRTMKNSLTTSQKNRYRLLVFREKSRS